jgi:hypothetical protein
MERFNKKAAAIIDLQQRGYDLDFILNNENLLRVQHREPITPDDFEITEVSPFSGQERLKRKLCDLRSDFCSPGSERYSYDFIQCITKRMSFHLWFKLAPAFN